MRVGGVNLPDAVVDHGGCMDGIAGSDVRAFLHQGQCLVRIPAGYGKHLCADLDQGCVGHFRQCLTLDGEIAVIS